MSVAVSPPEKKLMTVEEFLALPDDGKERWLIRGELRPREPAMSVRNRKHSIATARLTRLLGNWLETRPAPRGEIMNGDAGFRLKRTAESLVGIDVAFASAELMGQSAEKLPYMDGPPVLAVEVLSPSDTHEEVVEKILEYLDAGSVVWEVDPDLRIVRVHRPGQEPEMFTQSRELTTEPELPGFRVAVARIFAE
jgi:Uma2 family endonuclease